MSSTPAVFPTSIVTFTTKVNHIDVVNDDDCNKLQNEVIAMQTYFGTNPQGNKSDLTTRIGQMMATNGAIAQGVAFPTNPVEGQLFWRTDLITMYVYGSSAWNSQGQSLSNVIFVLTATLISTIGSGSFDQKWNSKFKKISGISTLTFYANFGASGSNTQLFKVDVGGLNSTVAAVTSGTSFQSNSINVSGLTNGTVYDIALSIGKSDANGQSESVIHTIIFAS